MVWFRYSDDVLILQLYLQPGSKTDNIDGIHIDRLKIRIKAPAIEDRANDYLIKFLAGHFAVPKSSVELSRGRQSRQKTIRIQAPRKWPDWFNELTGNLSITLHKNKKLQ